MTQIDIYFSGQALYGDDFGPKDIDAWFADEKEGYADLGASDEKAYQYGYHALNWQHGFRHVQGLKAKRLLGFGSAYGDELRPVLPDAEHVTIVDPSDAFVRPEVMGKPARYVKPSVDGRLPFADGAFDLATCFGVLYHVPNVSFVVRELARVMAPAGRVLLREPIISMGDWRQPRRGLTKRERGIPLRLLRDMIQNAGLNIAHQQLCMFPTTTRLFGRGGAAAYNSPLAVTVDRWSSAVFAWNLSYHPTSVWKKLRPSSAFFVLEKP
jgi:SAM-dependent methyltransferase